MSGASDLGGRIPAALGIDVGGTKVALGVVTAGGRMLRSARVHNRDAATPADLLAMVASAARALVSATGPGLAGVGIGMPELVDLSGNIRTGSVMPWTNDAILSALLGLGPVFIEADVRAAAMAEGQFGAGSGYGAFCYLTIGTGVSCTMVRHGHPVRGAHGAAQLLGSGRIALRCPACDALADVSLEDLASGPVLAARFGERTGSQVPEAEEVFAAAERGDLTAGEVLDQAAHVAGSFVAMAVNLLDPEAVVVGGGLGSAGGAWWEQLVASARDHIWASYVRGIPIIPARLGPAAGVIGAGLCALAQFADVSVLRSADCDPVVQAPGPRAVPRVHPDGGREGT